MCRSSIFNPFDEKELSMFDIHIWCIDLDNCNDNITVLSEAEFERLNKFKLTINKKRYYTYRTALRRIISNYLNINPAKITFAKNKYGKPSLSSNLNEKNISFNISHSNEKLLIAVTLKNDIGIDLEYTSDNRKVFDISSQVFTSQELKLLESVNNKVDMFYRIWTRKEAFLKASGYGMFMDMSKINIPIKKDFLKKLAEPDEINIMNNIWYVYDVSTFNKYTSSFVVKDMKKKVTLLYY